MEIGITQPVESVTIREGYLSHGLMSHPSDYWNICLVVNSIWRILRHDISKCFFGAMILRSIFLKGNHISQGTMFYPKDQMVQLTTLYRIH